MAYPKMMWLVILSLLQVGSPFHGKVVENPQPFLLLTLPILALNGNMTVARPPTIVTKVVRPPPSDWGGRGESG
jgi:hypothetical protein